MSARSMDAADVALLPSASPRAARSPSTKRPRSDSLDALEASLRGGAVPAHPAANIMKPDAGKSNTNLYLMIAGYVVLYYVFSGG